MRRSWPLSTAGTWCRTAPRTRATCASCGVCGTHLCTHPAPHMVLQPWAQLVQGGCHRGLLDAGPARARPSTTFTAAPVRCCSSHAPLRTYVGPSTRDAPVPGYSQPLVTLDLCQPPQAAGGSPRPATTFPAAAAAASDGQPGAIHLAAAARARCQWRRDCCAGAHAARTPDRAAPCRRAHCPSRGPPSGCCCYSSSCSGGGGGGYQC